jgi:hypothetical protein
MLARELLSKPDGFLLARLEDKEYVIDSLRRTFTYANVDDSVCRWVMNLRDGGDGYIKR